MDILAPSRWKCIEFLSDIHLDVHEPATFALWEHYLRTTQADAIFILGDLFELWVGDDALDLADSFEKKCATVLHAAGNRADLFIMPGNRDFLMGARLMAACQAQAIPDPCVLQFQGQRFVLSHGDALCVDDTGYQTFRTMVRSVQWQHDFLRKPYGERLALARGMRAQSASQQKAGMSFADVDTQAALHLLQTQDATLLLHGHTHRPGEVALAQNKTRWVLSDWVAATKPPRADVLRLTARGDAAFSLSRAQVHSAYYPH